MRPVTLVCPVIVELAKLGWKLAPKNLFLETWKLRSKRTTTVHPIVKFHNEQMEVATLSFGNSLLARHDNTHRIV